MDKRRSARWWNNLPLRGKGLVVVALPLVALLVATLAFALLQRQLEDVQAQVRHTLEVRAELQRVHTILLEEEVAVRARFLAVVQGAPNLSVAPAVDTFRTLTTAIINLEQLLAGDAKQQERLRTVKTLVEQEVAALVRALGEEPGAASATVRTLPAPAKEFLTTSRNTLAQLRQELGFMLYEEDLNLARGIEQAESLRRRIAGTLVAGSVLGLGGGVAAAVLFGAGIGRRVRRSADNARRLAEGLPLVETPGGGDEVGQLGAALEETRALLVEREAALRRAKMEAEHANAAKSAFLANVSHELRTPLNAIIGFTRLVLQRSGDQLPGQQHENLQKVLVSAEQLLMLINGLLDLAKIEAGKMEVVLDTFPIGAVIDLAVSTVEPTLKTTVTLIKDIDPAVPPLQTDREKLRQIVTNLLGNAAKFTERGSITIAAWAQEGRLVLTVTDTGVGISPEALPHIFEEFRQADMSTTRRFGGTGLGLAIVRQFSRLLGGEVDVTSVLGQGSTFTVILPLSVDTRAPEAVTR